VRRIFAVFVLAGVAGCAAPSEEATSEEEVRAARCETAYAAPLRAKVAKARARLDDAKSSVAIEVREALDRKKAKVLPFCAVTPDDFEQIAKDTDLSAGGATKEEQYRRLRAGDESVMRRVHGQIYGYQWGDRIYLASTMGESRTLETLAHEVRHVLRHAHLRNFDDQRVTCVEEYEAALAERLVHTDTLTAEERLAILEDMKELYELDKLAPGTCGY
jgi:hypothetical protein